LHLLRTFLNTFLYALHTLCLLRLVETPLDVKRSRWPSCWTWTVRVHWVTSLCYLGKIKEVTDGCDILQASISYILLNAGSSLIIIW